MARLTSMAPTRATPWPGRSSQRPAPMPSAMTIRPAGQRCARRSRNSNSSAAAHRAAPRPFHCPACASKPGTICSTSPCGGCTPSTPGSCLTMMTMARPKEKPRNTGLAMNCVTLPSLATQASRKNPPVSITSPAISMSRCPAVPPGMDAMAAASTAADEDVAETMAKRLVPSTP